VKATHDDVPVNGGKDGIPQSDQVRKDQQNGDSERVGDDESEKTGEPCHWWRDAHHAYDRKYLQPPEKKGEMEHNRT
jgi:hypothetical protein